MKIFAFVAAFLVSASTLFAEGTPEDEATIAALKADLKALVFCIVSVEMNEKGDCVSLAYDACLERSVDKSRSAESNCRYQELRMWRVIHGGEVVAAVARAQAADSERLLFNEPAAGNHERYVEAEALWLKFAESQCALEMMHWGAGTIVSTERPLCLARMYAERVVFLRGLEFG